MAKPLISILRFSLAASLLLTSVSRADEPKVERFPLSIFAFTDFGQVVEGRDFQHNPPEGQKFIHLSMDLLQQTGVAVSQRTIVNERLDMQVGIGGLFWYAFPQVQGTPSTINIKFGPGIVRADGIYKFGDIEAPKSELQFGFFNYKYNPDAKNLGEYLFRSNAYPGVLKTGDWTWVNSAGYQTLGARWGLSTLNGSLKHDFLLFTERSNFPVLSMSPGYVGTWDLHGVLEVGAGVSFQHLVPFKPSQLTPRSDQSTYVKLAAFPVIAAVADSFQYPGDPKKTLVTRRGHAGGAIEGIESEIKKMKDAAGESPYEEKLQRNKTTGVIVNKSDAAYIAAPTDFENTTTFRYARTKESLTFRGIKTMGRVAFDLGHALDMDNSIGEDNLKMYAEVAILGVQNQPFFYEDIAKRIPVMVGVNLPSFHILDVLSIQMEYYGSDFRNSQRQSYINNLPVWSLPSEDPVYFDPARNQDDNMKWSIFAKRSIIPGLNAFLQVASDHLRTRDDAGIESEEPVLSKPSDWYYLIRMDYGF